MTKCSHAQTQEMWSALVPALITMNTYQSGGSLSPAQLLLLGMFLAHYTWRSFAYPLLMRGGKPTPVGIWLVACAFCMYNGYMQVHLSGLINRPVCSEDAVHAVSSVWHPCRPPAL